MTARLSVFLCEHGRQAAFLGVNVNEMLMGETLFSIDTPLPIRWKPEERRFFYHGEAYRQRVAVNVQFVPELPDLLVQELYHTRGLRIGLDKDGNEVRVYTAAFMSGQPLYAVSVLKDSIVTIYFIDKLSIWNNPNIRIWNLVHMERLFLRVGAMVLHCSYLMYEGKAILFSAPSGTGKTTQAKLWEKLYPAHIVNGDKAILQKKNGIWYACGYPFHGSADECLNQDYPIEAVVVVRQNPTDFIEEFRPLQKLQAVYSETTVNAWDAESVNQTLNLVSDLVTNVQVVCQQCTMKDDACHTLQRYLKEN